MERENHARSVLNPISSCRDFFVCICGSLSWFSITKWITERAGRQLSFLPRTVLVVMVRMGFPFTTEEHGVAVFGHLYDRLKLFETSSYGSVW